MKVICGARRHFVSKCKGGADVFSHPYGPAFCICYECGRWRWLNPIENDQILGYVRDGGQIP